MSEPTYSYKNITIPADYYYQMKEELERLREEVARWEKQETLRKSDGLNTN